MSDEQAKPKKIKPVVREVAAVGNNKRYRAQRGRTIVTFDVTPDFKMTLVASTKSDEVKEFRFIESDPLLMRAVAGLFKDAAKFVLKLKEEAETPPKEDRL